MNRHSRRPLIGVTGPDRGGFPAWVFTWLAVRRAGGKPIRLRPMRYTKGNPLPPIDGLIIGGGADVHPGLYGGQILEFMDSATPPAGKRTLPRLLSWIMAPLVYLLRRFLSLSSGSIDEARDEFEDRCLRHALESDCPILGICRGAQFINVHFGGTLHADLAGFYGEVGRVDSVYPRKRVNIRKGTRLQKILRRNRARVNSLHKQAVNDLGKGIRVSARDESGVIQAIEHTGLPMVVGVQWHPEYLPFLRSQLRLFRALVRRSSSV
ncbi:MAG: gamma-glutamyl-gamma-aminobutyrate hydrolase family protein [Candidatus Sumerlaeia bacterium]|nr:gamma-glutamyl-gamma-aminobutyrate hydrolase family protein [Candidatus Sumerlaeia bacterium]